MAWLKSEKDTQIKFEIQQEIYFHGKVQNPLPPPQKKTKQMYLCTVQQWLERGLKIITPLLHQEAYTLTHAN